MNVYKTNDYKRCTLWKPVCRTRNNDRQNSRRQKSPLWHISSWAEAKTAATEFLFPKDATCKTHPFDASKVKDPSLIIYYPIRDLGKIVIVTNGDQTDTIRDAILSGGTFETALDTREFEPDGPNWTPRISRNHLQRRRKLPLQDEHFEIA